jgi:hypothetical protein
MDVTDALLSVSFHESSQELLVLHDRAVLAEILPDTVAPDAEVKSDHSPTAHAFAHLFAAAPKLFAFVNKLANSESAFDQVHRADAEELVALARGEL